MLLYKKLLLMTFGMTLVFPSGHYLVGLLYSNYLELRYVNSMFRNTDSPLFATFL